MSRLIENIDIRPRRLPVFFFVQYGYSWEMDVINAVITQIFSKLRQDPFALEVVYVSVLTFDEQLHALMPLTNITEIEKIPMINPSIKCSSLLDNTIDSLIKYIDGVVIKTNAEKKGDWRPSIIIFTDKELIIDELQKACGALHLGYNLLVEDIFSSILVIQITGKKDKYMYPEIRIEIPHAIAAGQEYNYHIKDIHVLNY